MFDAESTFSIKMKSINSIVQLFIPLVLPWEELLLCLKCTTANREELLSSLIVNQILSISISSGRMGLDSMEGRTMLETLATESLE